jgi:putative spermidine/putrescine transport system permease protein
MTRRPETLRLVALAAPAVIVFAAFFLLPLARLFAIGAEGPDGWGAYERNLSDPRHLNALVSTAALSESVSCVTLVV